MSPTSAPRLCAVDRLEIFRELLTLQMAWPRGRQGDAEFTWENVKLCEKRLRAMLPTDPDLVDGASLRDVRYLVSFLEAVRMLCNLEAEHGEIPFGPPAREGVILKNLIQRFTPSRPTSPLGPPQAKTEAPRVGEGGAGDDKRARAKLDNRNRRRRPSVNARMLETIQSDPEAMGWNSRQWAEYLKCAKSTVVETRTWKDLSMGRDRERAERARDRRRKPKMSDRRREQ